MVFTDFLTLNANPRSAVLGTDIGGDFLSFPVWVKITSSSNMWWNHFVAAWFSLKYGTFGGDLSAYNWLSANGRNGVDGHCLRDSVLKHGVILVDHY
jgi:hypothetical protein